MTLPSIPTAKRLPDRTPYQIDGPARVLVLPDIHVPFHDEEALGLALEWGRKHKATHILLNGDFIDFAAVSAWDSSPEDRDIMAEINMAKGVLDCIRRFFPKQFIVYKEGNHEERLKRYVWKHAPELAGLPTLTIQQLLDLKGRRIQYVDNLKGILLGSLSVIHGHENRHAISNPVNPARGLFLKELVSTMCSHFHQRSEHSARNGHGKIITTWSTGCLCQLSPNYNSRNNWSHGFAFVVLTKGGAFSVLNPRIIHGNVYT